MAHRFFIISAFCWLICVVNELYYKFGHARLFFLSKFDHLTQANDTVRRYKTTYDSQNLIVLVFLHDMLLIRLTEHAPRSHLSSYLGKYRVFPSLFALPCRGNARLVSNMQSIVVWLSSLHSSPAPPPSRPLPHPPLPATMLRQPHPDPSSLLFRILRFTAADRVLKVLSAGW